MPDVTHWTIFLSAAFVLLITPGPSIMYVMCHRTRFSRSFALGDRPRVGGPVASSCHSRWPFRVIGFRTGDFFGAQICRSSLPCRSRAPNASRQESARGRPYWKKPPSTEGCETLADSAGLYRTEPKDSPFLLGFFTPVRRSESWFDERPNTDVWDRLCCAGILNEFAVRMPWWKAR